MLPRDRAPRQQPGLLERDARSPGRCRAWRGGLAEHLERRRRLAESRSAMRRSSVDLPQPEGPMSETNSPAATSSSTPVSAATSPGLRGEDLADIDSAYGPVRSMVMRLPLPCGSLLSQTPTSAAGPAATSPSAIEPKVGPQGAAGSLEALSGQLDEHPPDAAAPSRSTPRRPPPPTDVGGSQSRAPAAGTARRPATEAQQNRPSTRRRNCASGRGGCGRATRAHAARPTADREEREIGRDAPRRTATGPRGSAAVDLVADAR